jgi:hypothetical protein
VSLPGKRRKTMSDQFENPEATKLEDETASDLTAKQRMERIAEKAAGKSAKTEQEFEENQENFTI